MQPNPFQLAPALVLLCSNLVFAQNKSELPLWELGGVGFAVSQQAYPGSDQQVTRSGALPVVVYRGKIFRSDGDTLGLRALKTNQYEVDVGVSGSFGGGGERIDARAGMAQLGTMVEFGPRLKWNFGEMPGKINLTAKLPLRGVFDLSDSAAYKGLSFEPELALSRRSSGGWAYSTSVGAIFGNQRLAATYYGVDAPFALANRPAFKARSGLLAWRLGLSASKSISPDWRFFGFARLDSVGGAVNELSPLVRQKSGMSAGFGLQYTWLRSKEAANP